MCAKQKQIRGFTIVELLIVIVVIGILAAITIVSFSGVQNRAKNQQTISAVRSYYSALKAYGIDNNGALPSGNGCLGSPEAYAANPCYIGANTYNYTASITNALAPYVSTAPNLPGDRVTTGSITASGIFYYSNGQYIGFVMLSTDTCPAIAGAIPDSQFLMTPHIYCKIKLPTT